MFSGAGAKEAPKGDSLETLYPCLHFIIFANFNIKHEAWGKNIHQKYTPTFTRYNRYKLFPIKQHF